MTLRTALALGLVTLTAEAPAAHPPFEGTQRVDVRYYDVSGRTSAEIRTSLNRANRVDPSTGMRVDAYTAWDLRWWIPGEPEGPCRVDLAAITLEVEVGLPRLVHTERVPPGLLEQWQRYRAALEAHEANHARNAEQASKEMREAIRHADCATAPRAAEDVLDALRRRNEDYDRLTRHGATEGARFP